MLTDESETILEELRYLQLVHLFDYLSTKFIFKTIMSQPLIWACDTTHWYEILYSFHKKFRVDCNVFHFTYLCFHDDPLYWYLFFTSLEYFVKFLLWEKIRVVFDNEFGMNTKTFIKITVVWTLLNHVSSTYKNNSGMLKLFTFIRIYAAWTGYSHAPRISDTSLQNSLFTCCYLTIIWFIRFKNKLAYYDKLWNMVTSRIEFLGSKV